MKKPFAALFLLLLLVVSVIVACTNGKTGDKTTADDVGVTTDGATDGGSTTTDETTDPPVTLMGSDNSPISDTDLHGWLAYGGTQTLRDNFTVDTRDSIAISMAKNEMEGFQYVMASNVDYEGLRCEVSTLSDGKGNTLEGTVSVAWYMYTLPSDYLPFALLDQDAEYQGGTFHVDAGHSQTLYIRYITTADTVPGTYTGTLEIKQGDTVLKSHDVSVTVWNLYYDEATEAIVPFGYGFSWDPWEKPVPASAPDMREKPEREFDYADFLLTYRMSPWRMPNDLPLTDGRVAKYLNNPRLNCVYMFANVTPEALPAQYEICLQNGWLDKITLAIGDEPRDEGFFQHDISRIEPLKQYFPTTQWGIALLKDQPLDGRNVVERFADHSTFHVLKKQLICGYPELLESCMKLKAERGDKILWYVCGDEPYNQIDATAAYSGTLQNVLFWQQYLYNIDGLLYWCANYWEGLPDFWAPDFVNNEPSYKEKREMNYGNGCTFVWDPITGDPVPTCSAEGLRDGIEDFQLMKMAEEVLGRETVLSYVKRITGSCTSFTKDGALLAQVRNQIAEALIAATAQ